MTSLRPRTPDQRPSPLPVLLMLAYAAAVVYGTLYPWRGWRSLGLSPLTFLGERLNWHFSWIDLVANAVMLMPLGALATTTAFARRRPLAGWLIAVAGGSLLSLCIEATQTFIPSRVPSKLDWLTNTGGMMVGASIGLLLNRLNRNSPYGIWHRPDLFRLQSGAMLFAIGAWLAAQAAPQRMMFETGSFLEPLLRLLRAQASDGTIPGEFGQMVILASRHVLALMDMLHPLAAYSPVIESMAVAASLAAIGLIVTDTLAPAVSRAAAIGAVLLMGISLHLMSATWVLAGTDPGGWLSSGSQGGLLTGLVMLVLLSTARRRTRLRLALLLLVVALVLTNLFSPNVYQDVPTSGVWVLGFRRNLLAMVRAVAMVWPFIAAWALIMQLREGARSIIDQPQAQERHERLDQNTHDRRAGRWYRHGA